MRLSISEVAAIYCFTIQLLLELIFVSDQLKLQLFFLISEVLTVKSFDCNLKSTCVSISCNTNIFLSFQPKKFNIYIQTG